MYRGGQWVRSAQMVRKVVMTQAKKQSLKAGDKDQGAHISCLAGIWVKNKRTLLKWNRVRQEAAIFRGPREHSVFFPFSLNSIV